MRNNLFHSVWMLFFILCAGVSVLAQTEAEKSEYNKFKLQAESHFEKTHYGKSAKLYEKAFSCFNGKAYLDDRYNAARSWAMAGNSKNAIFHLSYLYDKSNFLTSEKLRNDQNFHSLHEDSAWKALLDSIDYRKQQIEKDYIHPLIDLLDSMVSADQDARNAIRNYRNGETDTSKLSKSELTLKMIETDSLNYIILARIFQQYGYLGFKRVGKQGEHDFWLLVQHMDQHPEFQLQVLDKMKTEVENNNADRKNYAYLVDRVQVNTGKAQVYGTQMKVNDSGTSFEPKKLDAPELVDERRKSVGLSPIAEYIEMMNEHFYGDLRK